MNKINDQASFVARRVIHPLVAALFAVLLPGLASAALTDLSSTPIAANASAQAKPNIMLLMDTSGSMSWGHMPDEVEQDPAAGYTDGQQSIGYKSAQCNVLYYNPHTTYILPKLPSGASFSQPDFTNAHYSGYAAYFTAPDSVDTSIVDLSQRFRAYDSKTLRATTSVTPDNRQPAYYYVYSGPQTLVYNSAACRQLDTSAATIPAVGGGTWTRVLVGANSGPVGDVDERANFAVWYSYYRTRLSLIKSAGSLAFTPLTDSFRVGFITVEPKNSPTDAGINPDRYVQIADFNIGQRNTWFNKLFSQTAKGASPAREGLARVGRHYAGKQDGINTNMVGDPVQYYCQQNFTIMTTDGYWNAQTETPGAGPVQIDGTTKVGQQDGTLTATSGNSPRPIWEGFLSDTSVTTDNNNSFQYQACGTYLSKSTAQTSISTTQLVKDTSQLVTRTVQTTSSTLQLSVSTAQTLASTVRHTQSTTHVATSTSQLSRSTTQVLKTTSQLVQQTIANQQRQDRIQMSTSQITAATSQLTKATSQLLQGTVQTRIATSQTSQSTSQKITGTTQPVVRTSQQNIVTSTIFQTQSQTKRSTTQTSMTTKQDRKCDARTEVCNPVATGSCHPGIDDIFRYCETDTEGPTLVSSCVPSDPTVDNNYITTTCSTVSTGPTVVASCTAAAANDGDNFVATTCDPGTPTVTAVANCTTASPSSSNSYTTTSCNTVTSPATPTGSCSVAVANSQNGYVSTSCPVLTTGPTGTNSCMTSPATSTNMYVATSCGTITTGPTGTQACASDPGTATNSWVTTTCDTVNTGPTPVNTCTNSTGGTGNSWVNTSCSTTTTGPTEIASCSPIGATSSNAWTTTSCPNIVNTGVGVASCATAPGDAGNHYTATTCNTVTSGPTGTDSCPGNIAASSSNSYLATVCNTATTGPSPAASCTQTAASAANQYVSTTCDTLLTPLTPVASCSTSAATSGNNYTTTSCSNLVVQDWTNTQTCAGSGPNSGNGYTTTSCRLNAVSSVGVPNCTPSGPDVNGIIIQCPTILTPPVGVQNCTPQTAGPDNHYVDIFCGNGNTGPTLVSTCSDSPASIDNQWTATTCTDAPTGPTWTPSCTPQVAGSGNNYVATTCSTTTTGPNDVQTCNYDAPTLANDYTTTSCLDVVTGPTAAQACMPGPATVDNHWTATSCQPVATGPTLTASCTDALASSTNSWTATICGQVVTPPTGVSSCTVAAATPEDNYVSTACVTDTSPDVGTGACTPIPATADNQWKETQCVTKTASDGADVCMNASANDGNQWTSTNCSTFATGPTLTDSCSQGPAGSGNHWTATTCNTITTPPVSVQSCTPAAASADNNYIATFCTSTPGKKISFVTTTTATTTQYSAGLQVGLPVTTTATGSLTDVDGVCFAPGAEPALPSPNPLRAGLTASNDGITVGPYPPAPACTAWPCTVASHNSGGSVNSLADVAQYYYVTDLRPELQDSVPQVGTGPEDDRATWQHMTTFVVGLGVSGTLNYRPDYKSSAATTGDFAEIRTGPRNWPVWPDSALNYDPLLGGSFAAWNDPRSIDDFWHTAVNGRGTYFNAGDPGSVITGLGDALASLAVRTGSGSGVTVSNAQPVTGDNFAYSTTYTTSKWTGDVQATDISVSDGSLAAIPNWSAAQLLDTRTSAACDSRTIYLMHMGVAGNKVNFSWNTQACDALGAPTGPVDTGLDSTEMAYFGLSAVSQFSQFFPMTPLQRTQAQGANLVNFLRGQRGLEGFSTTDRTKLYRTRADVLGDIVDGQPVYVKAPFATYEDVGYSAFKTAQAGRTPMLYVPANDGMLHAFYAGVSDTDTQGGKEAWAFIPSAVLPNLYKLADNDYKNNHQFYVDGTPVAGDAYDGSAWKTIVVGGLNAGGKSYYALDVTNPASPKGLWEFKFNGACYDGTAATASADCHLGYTYGKPIITKLSSNRWVVMFTSGYNNVRAPAQTGDGGGYLYVLDAFNGQILYKIATGAGDPTTPSGLAQINNYVELSSLNNTTRQVYGGDLLGNVWRFDVNDTIAPSGREAALVGVATDKLGARQPITTRPELAEMNAKPMIFVGTGKLLGVTDFSDAQGQSVYGIVDPLTPGPVYGNLRTTFKPLVIPLVDHTVADASRTVSCPAASTQCGATDGWVVDLPDHGERVNIDMQLARGTLIFASNVPNSDDACNTGGYSWLNYLSFSTGLAVSTSPNQAVSVQAVQSLATGLNVIGIGDGLVGIRRFSAATNQGHSVPYDVPPPSGKRISWREIPQK